MTERLLALQSRLQHMFSRPELLKRALTHRSFSADHNERLEFLGDSVLNLAVSDLLFERLESLPEGDLSRVRANLVKQDTLHQLALEMGLADLINVGEGEIRSNLAVGGVAAKTELTPRGQEICAALAPELKRRGLIFVGIDVIGGEWLTEINVTSPTGLQELQRFDGTNVSRLIWDAVEARL